MQSLAISDNLRELTVDEYYEVSGGSRNRPPISGPRVVATGVSGTMAGTAGNMGGRWVGTKIGAKIGGKIGATIGGPVGAIAGAGIGAGIGLAGGWRFSNWRRW